CGRAGPRGPRARHDRPRGCRPRPRPRPLRHRLARARDGRQGAGKDRIGRRRRVARARAPGPRVVGAIQCRRRPEAPRPAWTAGPGRYPRGPGPLRAPSGRPDVAGDGRPRALRLGARLARRRGAQGRRAADPPDRGHGPHRLSRRSGARLPELPRSRPARRAPPRKIVMGWRELAIGFVYWFNLFVLFYFLALNTIYLVLFLVSLREVFRFVRRTFFSDYGQIMQSEMTWPISILVPAHNEEKTIVE